MPGNTFTELTVPSTTEPILPRQVLAQAITGVPFERYVQEALAHGMGGATLVEMRAQLSDPAKCLSVLYRRYAFARRGKDRRVTADLACSALDRACANARGLTNTNPAAIWEAFVAECSRADRKPQEDQNRGVILGLAELALRVAIDSGMSLAGYAAHTATTTHRVESVFFSMVELRGVGPKVASTILRDWVYIFDVEQEVHNRDSIYLQPVDRWTRLAAPWLLEEGEGADFPDWILAGKLGRAARLAGVSGIQLNMGLGWLGNEASARSDPEGRFVQLLQGLNPVGG